MPHNNIIKDKDPCFTVDAITRAVKNVSATKTTVIQYDHNSERFTFTLPRYIENHDMLECNVVEVHYIAPNGTPGLYTVTDLQEDTENANNVVCTWLLSQNVTKEVGALQFLIRFSCVKDGVIEYAWNTGINKDITVGSGIYNTEIIAELYPDILQQWKEELYTETQKAIEDFIAEGNIEATKIKSVTILKEGQKKIGWVKFATIPYSHGWRSENALLYINSHYVESKFAGLVYIGLQPNGADYHTNNGIVLKQIAGDNIAQMIAYYKNPDTREITLYFHKNAYTTLNISTIFNGINRLTFEPSNDACVVTENINITGKATYITAPTAERDNEGRKISDTYATKEELNNAGSFKGEMSETSLAEVTAKQGDIYKLTSEGTEKQYKSGAIVYCTDWGEEYAYYYVEGMYSLMTEEENTIYEQCCEDWDACNYRTPFNISVDFYNTSWEYVGTTAVYYSESPVQWVFEDYEMHTEKPEWLNADTAYNLVRTDGKTSKYNLPTHRFEAESDLYAGDYAIYNGTSFDKLYTAETIDKKLAELQTAIKELSK